MRPVLGTGVCALVAALAAPALAQQPEVSDPYAPLQFDAAGRVILAIAAMDVAGADNAETVTARLELEFGVETVLESGLALGAELDIAAERDHPARSPRGGRAGACPAGVADCATVNGASVRAPVSGYAGAAVRDQGGRPRGAIEEAYVYLDGGWGEVSLGLTEGAAAELSLPTPTLLAAASIVDGDLNPSGLGGAQTVNDFSGSSTKIALESVSLLGFTAGLSYAPETNHRTMNQGYPRRAGEAVTFEGENIWEAGLGFNRTWASGLETRAAITYLTAETAVSAPEWGRLQSWSAGLRLGYGAVEGGVSFLESDNGWALGDRGYQAYAASGIYNFGDWAVMLEGASADDDLAHVQTDSLQAALRRALTETSGVTISLLHQERAVPRADSLGRTQGRQRGTGLLLEFAADL